ncbi:MAG TPA: acyl-CoA synthetase, partial [Acidimicrobiales bacterium]|nr:acyl-CoA synthetase [Acidimicrobiales bacterium]
MSEVRSGVFGAGGFVPLEQLDDRARRAASGLESLGVREGDVIALLLRNDYAAFEASWAASLIGATAVPINWHLSPSEVAYIVTDCQAKVLIAHADLLSPVRSDLDDALQVVAVPTPGDVAQAFELSPASRELGEGETVWESWLAQFPPHGGDFPVGSASMIYTSGTTGRPKGVRLLPVAEEFLPLVDTVRRAVGLEPGMRTVMSAPMYHAAPNKYALTAVRMGGVVVLQPRFDAEQLLALVEEHSITHLYMVPTMFVRLLRLSEEVRSKYDLSSLRHIVHAAAPCPEHVKRSMIEWLGPIVHEYYGSTEVGAVVACSSEEWLTHPGTVGRPIANARVRVFSESGEEVATREIGEIYLRCPANPDFTYEGKPQDRVEMERDGLITVGDLGYVDADGFLYLCDRKRDMVISGGVNIYPAEVEAQLLTMPGVRDCAVFGIPDDEFGESLAAAVEVDAEFVGGESEVRTYLRGRLASYKVPKLVTFHDRLPRQASGKIFKRELRDPYWMKAGRS